MDKREILRKGESVYIVGFFPLSVVSVCPHIFKSKKRKNDQLQ